MVVGYHQAESTQHNDPGPEASQTQHIAHHEERARAPDRRDPEIDAEHAADPVSLVPQHYHQQRRVYEEADQHDQGICVHASLVLSARRPEGLGSLDFHYAPAPTVVNPTKVTDPDVLLALRIHP